MADPPFSLIEPTGGDSPVLVEIPHAGLELDAESASWISAPVRCIARDADLYVHEIFARAPSLGATLLYAHFSRYIVDLNRAEDDYDGAAVIGGPARDRPRGVIWRLTSDGIGVLAGRIPHDEYLRRTMRFYRPYHQAIEQVLLRKRARFGFAVMLCAHSMPTPRDSFARAGGHARGRAPRLDRPQAGYDADLVPGTRGRSSAAGCWIDLVEQAGKERGWTVQHDMPYRGGFSTGHYGRPDERVHAIQIEIARRLYMDERSLARAEQGFAQVQAFADGLVERLVDEAQAQAHGEAGE